MLKQLPHNVPDFDEKALIIRLREGDQRAFECIYTFYFPRLAQFLYRYVRSTHIAEDLVHNVFFTVWSNRRQLQEVDSLRPYLYRACRNQALKQLRRDQIVVNPEDFDSHVDWGHNAATEEDLDVNDLNEALIQAINDMPDRRRQIYLLNREDGLTYMEIAEVLEISVKTVETQISRSLKYLRDKLKGFLHP